MGRRKKPCVILIVIVMISLAWAELFTNCVSGQVQPILAVEEQLQGISETEKAILEELFTLSQKIEEMDRKEIQIIEELEAVQTGAGNLEKRLAENQKRYDRQLEVLKKILVSYQRRGPASYLEILLGADDVAEFLRGLNIIKDLSRNSGELLSALIEGKKQLEIQKEELSEQENLLKDVKAKLEEALQTMLRYKEEQEQILISLAGQRDIYEGELNYIQTMWDEIKVLFSDILIYFTNIFAEGFPIETLNLRISFPEIQGTIYDQVINDILKSQPDMPAMVFDFDPDQIMVEVPEKRLILKGNFFIEDESILIFKVEEGSFYGMPLSESSIEELFRSGSLILDFKELMGEIQLQSVETFEGYLEFVITPAVK